MVFSWVTSSEATLAHSDTTGQPLEFNSTLLEGCSLLARFKPHSVNAPFFGSQMDLVRMRCYPFFLIRSCTEEPGTNETRLETTAHRRVASRQLDRAC